MDPNSKCVHPVIAVMVTALISLAATAVADSCSYAPWNETVCCTDGETKPGAENKLSIDCEFGQPLSDGTTTILVWEGSESIIAGHSPERLYLYSSCVDPTTTYLHLQNTSITTLFHDSNLRTLSTEIIEPSISKCGYFGCYEAARGFYYYTFSEVSCTSVGFLASKPESAIAVSTQQVRRITSVQSNKNSQTISGSYTILMSPSYTSTSDVTVQQGLEKYWWYMLLLTITLLVGCGGLLGIVIIRHCRRRSDIRSNRWPSHMWHLSGVSTLTEKAFRTFETASINSEHTTYEEIVYAYRREVCLN